METQIQKTTIVPISAFDRLDNGEALLPKMVSDSVSIENVQGILDSKDFELWHEYISAEDRKALAQVRVALVNRFTSSGHMGEEEKRSEDLLRRYFVCLRIIKPTRSRYQAIQFKHLENGIDVFHVSGPHPSPLNLPDAEILNDINAIDVTQLIQRIEPFLDVEANGPFRVRRAIRLYETGYSEIRDPALQFITWLMGVEAMVSEGEEITTRDAIQRIKESVDLASPLYQESPESTFISMPDIRLGDVLEDAFSFRNRLVHGGWIPREWNEKPSRRGVVQSEVPYVEIVREAASLLLRKLILGYLTSPNSFN